MNVLLLGVEQAAQAFTTQPVLDWSIFFGFIAAVIAIGIFMSRGKGDSESYFLAGRGLSWWLIGFSLIAANISTEQFVGMSGSAARPVGLAIAGFEWLAAITLIFVAFFFLPKFLRVGVYTIPEFLERRYSENARLLMSLCMVVMLIGVNISGVIYSGAKTIDVIFADAYPFIDITTASWIIGILAMLYVLAGGLKACAWADLLQGSALIIGGAIILFLALGALNRADTRQLAEQTVDQRLAGAQVDQATRDAEVEKLSAELEGASSFEKFQAVNNDRLAAIRPADDIEVPWTALLLGLWIPNFYYWGLNQYIMQRTLGAKSLAAGQQGIVFAAGLKLIIPFIVVFPGMMALNLYQKDMIEDARTNNNAPVIAQFEILSGKTLVDSEGNPLLSDAERYKAIGSLAGVDLHETNETGEAVLDESAKADAIDTIRAGGPVVFKMDADEFPVYYPEAALAIYEYNTTIVEADVDSSRPTAEKNAALVKAVEEKNGTTLDWLKAKLGMAEPIPQQPIATELIGRDEDAAFPLLIKKLVRPGLKGFMLAAIMGAVMSSLASMLNAASTICTMDLVKNYVARGASETSLVRFGRVFVFLFAILGCLIAPQLADPRFKGIFSYIQAFQGFISPGILAIFLFGMFVRRAPSVCGIIGLLLNPIIYGALMLFFGDIAYLDRMAITFGAILTVLTLVTVVFPRKEPFQFQVNTKIELKSSLLAKVCGVLVILATLALYWHFRGDMVKDAIAGLLGG